MTSAFHQLQIKVLPFVYAVILLACSPAPPAREEAALWLESPDGTIRVAFSLAEDQRPVYKLWHKGGLLLEESALGLVLEDADFSAGLVLEEVSDVEQVEEAYSMLQGKRLERRYKANQKTFKLKNADGRVLEIIFRLSDDGVAFRYHLPEMGAEPKKIIAEHSSFNFPEEAKGWLQPMAIAKTGFEGTNPSYEEYYYNSIAVGTPSPDEAGWVFPALFQHEESWVLVTETAPYGDYVGCHLGQESPGGEYSIVFPQEKERIPGMALMPETSMPWSSPWRIITVGSLKTIVESTLGTDLAKPAIEMDQSFIRPGRASWSWVLLKDDKTIYEVQKQFIDYAADMRWEYCLIDAGWDKLIGYDKIRELAVYAEERGVGLLLWYNSAGDWNTSPQTPRDLMLSRESRQKEFGRIAEMGIKGVKVDFFGSDGMGMMQYYEDILLDAAEHALLVNFHGSTLPRGWHRTYPHLMTMEAIRGLEFITFEQENADKEAVHAAVIPFARNVFDPMDFTPLVLYEIPGIERKTTNGFQLALPVIFLSGIQHFGETPAGMAHVPAEVKDYLREVPVRWDETRFVEGYPGQLVVIARRAGERWYVAGINGEDTQKSVRLDLSFIDQAQGRLFTDGAEPFSFRQGTVRPGDAGIYNISLKPNGGFVMVF